MKSRTKFQVEKQLVNNKSLKKLFRMGQLFERKCEAKEFTLCLDVQNQNHSVKHLLVKRLASSTIETSH